MGKFYISILVAFSLLLNVTHADELVNEGFRADSFPLGWDTSKINYETADGGYHRFAGNTGVIISPTFDWSDYENIEIKFSVAKYGAGADGPITVNISTDGGSTWTAYTEDSPTPTSRTYVNAIINVPNAVSMTSNVKIRFTSANSPSDKRFHDLIITGDEKANQACTAPTESPEGFSDFYTADDSSIELEWLDGDGDGRVIVMNIANSFSNLSEGADPTANLSYAGSGEQVIYNGTGMGPVIITNLMPNTTYYFKGYEYCEPDRVYNNSGTPEPVTTDIGSNLILTDEESYGPFCNGTSNNISVGFDELGSYNEDFKVQLSNADGTFPGNAEDNIIGSGSSSPISATIPASTSAGTKYRVRVVNPDPVTIGDDNSSDITILVTPTEPSPSQPSPICEGSSAEITATGSTGASSYTFWDAATDGNEITDGVSGNTLTTPNNLSAGTYTYYVQGENGSCASSRKAVTVTVNEVPATPSGSFTYSDNPSCGVVTISYNSGYYFQASANGTSTDYPTSSSYIQNVPEAIYVRAFNGDCWSDAVASDAIVLVNDVVIIMQPLDISVAENGSGSFSVWAGNVDTYQWQENDGSGWEDIAGATSSSLSISNPSASQDGYTYRVVLTGNAPCASVNSDPATLTVTAPSPISIWSNNITGTNSSDNNPFTNGDVTAPNIVVSGIGFSGVAKSGANNRYNTNNWSTSSLDAGKYFTWTIEAEAGYTFSATDLDITLRRSGTGPTNFEVRTSADNFVSSVSNSISGTNAIPYTIPVNISDRTELEIRLYGYRAGAAGGTFGVDFFDFKGFVYAAPSCEVPAPTGTFSYSANPSCGSATVSYNADYYFQESESGTSLDFPTSSSYVLNSSGTVYVRAYEDDCWSDAVASNPVVINSPINISVQPANISVPENGSGSFSVTASGASAYQWQIDEGGGWENISGANSAVLNISNADFSQDGNEYRVLLTAENPCSDVTSNTAVLSVTEETVSLWNNDITGTNPGMSNPFTTGDNRTIGIKEEGGVGYSSNIEGNAGNDRFNTRNWSTSSLDAGKYFTWTIEAEAGYTFSATDLDITLRRSGTGPTGFEVRTSVDNFVSGVSNSISGTNPVSYSIPVNVSDQTELEVRLYGYNAGSTGGTFGVDFFDFKGFVHAAPSCEVLAPTGTYSYSANPSCGSATVSYNAGYYFQESESGTSLDFPTSSSYVLNSSGTVYVRAYEDDCWSDAVASNPVVINSPINISVQPANISVPENGSGSFSVTASGVKTYQWQENDGTGWKNVSGANSSSLTITTPAPSKDGNIFRVFMSANAPCSNVYSEEVTLTVTAPVVAGIWTNPITDDSGDIQSPYKRGQTVAPHLIVSGLILNGASKTDAKDRFNSNTWDETLNLGKYFSWTLTPAPGYEMDLSDLNVTVQSSGSGPDNFAVRTSEDGFASNIYSESGVKNTTATHNIDIELTGVRKSVEIRVYAYGTANVGGAFSINDFNFSGIIKKLIPSGPCNTPANLSTSVNGDEVIFNWNGTEGADIHAIQLINSKGGYSYGFSPTVSGFKAKDIAPGTYNWKIISLCGTETYVTGNTSEWIQGGSFTVSQ